MKKEFDRLVVNIQELNNIKNCIREVETKLEDFRIWYKNLEEIDKLENDINSINNENIKLKRQMGQ